MSRYCLDTSAYSHFKRGDPQVVDLVDRADWIGVPAIVIGELRQGFLQGGKFARNETELQQFLEHTAVDMLPVDDYVAQAYADIVTEMKRIGRPLPTNDVWIAATAARAGAPVLTYDPHFAAVARIGSVVLVRGPAST